MFLDLFSAVVFLILTGYISYSPAVAMASMFAIVTGLHVAFTSLATNPLDLAPLHAGTIMGLVSTIDNFAAIAAPQAVGILTKPSLVALRVAERVLSHSWCARCRRAHIRHLRLWRPSALGG